MGKSGELAAEFALPGVLRDIGFSHEVGFVVDYTQARDGGSLKRARKRKKGGERLQDGGCGVRCHFMQPHCAKP